MHGYPVVFAGVCSDCGHLQTVAVYFTPGDGRRLAFDDVLEDERFDCPGCGGDVHGVGRVAGALTALPPVTV